jgi:predicted ATP-dependent serine protease
MKVSYTFHKLNDIFELRAIDQDHIVVIKEDHPKYEWIRGLESNRLVNINEQGHFNSSKDYHNAYGGGIQPKQVQEPKVSKPVGPITLTKLDDLNIDESLFVPLATNTVFDKFVSSEGGFLPGTNVMAAGAPGIGKTTVLLELLSKLQAAGKKVLFISAEMNQIDMARYLKRFPHWGQLPILFLGDYTEECPKSVIESVVSQGWDVILTDSYTEVNDTVKEACGMTRGKTEKWFLDLMDNHNKANNILSKHTTFVTILQLSKGGVFVGSNKLKHMATAMMHLDWDGSENSGRRYMEFSKNRGGDVNKKLFFDLNGGVTFDEARYARDLFNDDILAEERKALDSESNSFDKLFGFDKDSIPAELKTQVVEL